MEDYKNIVIYSNKNVCLQGVNNCSLEIHINELKTFIQYYDI